eukprot:75808-Prymnesium_polylepis.1
MGGKAIGSGVDDGSGRGSYGGSRGSHGGGSLHVVAAGLVVVETVSCTATAAGTVPVAARWAFF